MDMRLGDVEALSVICAPLARGTGTVKPVQVEPPGYKRVPREGNLGIPTDSTRVSAPVPFAMSGRTFALICVVVSVCVSLSRAHIKQHRLFKTT
ncbi:unnamed protein product, partial [Nesidiocoris tenuis]